MEKVEEIFGYLRSIILLLKESNINKNKKKHLNKIYRSNEIKRCEKIKLYKIKGHDIENSDHIIFKQKIRRTKIQFQNYLNKKKL